MRYCHQIFRLIGKAFSIVLTAQFCSLPQAAAAEDESLPVKIANGAYFQAKATQGVISYRLPFRVQWQNLNQVRRLPVGTILQLSEGAAVELNYRHRNLGALKTERTYVTIQSASTLILNEQLLRKVNADRYFFNMARSTENKLSPEQEAALPFDFQKSWQRVITYLRDPENAEMSFNLHGQDKFKLALRQKKISLLLPVDGDIPMTHNFPTKIGIAWANPLDTAQDFKVYITKYSEQEGKPVAIVRGEEYTATIPSPGSYLVRIASLDDRYSSFPHMTHLTSTMPDLQITQEIDKSEYKLLFPPDNFIFQTEENKAVVAFSGRLSSLKKKSRMTLHIRPESLREKEPNAEQVYSINTEFLQHITLPENSYQWWVEYYSLAGKSENNLGLASTIEDHHVSERRKFKILGGFNSRQSTVEILSGLLTQNDASLEPLMIYLADP